MSNCTDSAVVSFLRTIPRFGYALPHAPPISFSEVASMLSSHPLSPPLSISEAISAGAQRYSLYLIGVSTPGIIVILVAVAIALIAWLTLICAYCRRNATTTFKRGDSKRQRRKTKQKHSLNAPEHAPSTLSSWEDREFSDDESQIFALIKPTPVPKSSVGYSKGVSRYWPLCCGAPQALPPSPLPALSYGLLACCCGAAGCCSPHVYKYRQGVPRLSRCCHATFCAQPRLRLLCFTVVMWAITVLVATATFDIRGRMQDSVLSSDATIPATFTSTLPSLQSTMASWSSRALADYVALQDSLNAYHAPAAILTQAQNLQSTLAANDFAVDAVDSDLSLLNGNFTSMQTSVNGVADGFILGFCITAVAAILTTLPLVATSKRCWYRLRCRRATLCAAFLLPALTVAVGCFAGTLFSFSLSVADACHQPATTLLTMAENGTWVWGTWNHSVAVVTHSGVGPSYGDKLLYSTLADFTNTVGPMSGVYTELLSLNAAHVTSASQNNALLTAILESPAFTKLEKQHLTMLSQVLAMDIQTSVNASQAACDATSRQTLGAAWQSLSYHACHGPPKLLLAILCGVLVGVLILGWSACASAYATAYMPGRGLCAGCCCAVSPAHIVDFDDLQNHDCLLRAHQRCLDRCHKRAAPESAARYMPLLIDDIAAEGEDDDTLGTDLTPTVMQPSSYVAPSAGSAQRTTPTTQRSEKNTRKPVGSQPRSLPTSLHAPSNRPNPPETSSPPPPPSSLQPLALSSAATAVGGGASGLFAASSILSPNPAAAITPSAPTLHDHEAPTAATTSFMGVIRRASKDSRLVSGGAATGSGVQTMGEGVQLTSLSSEGSIVSPTTPGNNREEEAGTTAGDSSNDPRDINSVWR